MSSIKQQGRSAAVFATVRILHPGNESCRERRRQYFEEPSGHAEQSSWFPGRRDGRMAIVHLDNVRRVASNMRSQRLKRRGYWVRRLVCYGR